MKLIVTGDIHVSDKPKDEYRWDLFPWLRKQIDKHKAKMLVLVGDVTDAKNKHDESVVNRVVREIRKIADLCTVVFVPGNHDGMQEGRAFFRFLGRNDPNIFFVTRPLKRWDCLFLPHTRDYEAAWAEIDFDDVGYIFCHQTFEGCLSENGYIMEGIPPDVFGKSKAKVFSGDIHVPQKVGKNIQYVGAPYHIRFGDTFTPRVLLLDTTAGSQHDLHFSTIMKFVIDLKGDDMLEQLDKVIDRKNMCQGDYVKVRVHLRRRDFPDWPRLRDRIKAHAKDRQLVLWGPEAHVIKPGRKRFQGGARKPAQGQSPQLVLEGFGKREGLSDDLLKAGRGFLRGASKGAQEGY